MKKTLLSAVSMVAFAGSALAADLPSHKAPAPVMTTLSTWQGVYAGINAGYGLNNITTYEQNYAYGTGIAGFNAGALSSAGSTTQYVGGGVAGAQLGYNHVFANHWMAGAEIDFDWADIYNNANPVQANSATVISGALAPTAYVNNNYRRLGLDWVGTVRARIGYDMGRFLPYITGGFAYGGLSNTINAVTAGASFLSPFNGATSNSFITGSNSTVGLGWAAGAGAEYMVADNWSLRGEYLFTSIGGINTPITTVTSISAPPYGNLVQAGSGTISSGSFGVHQIRAGLNYHTNWWGSAPIVAKF